VTRWPAFIGVFGALVTAQAVASQKAPAVGVQRPAAMPAGDEEAGREAYAEDCRACHSGAIAPTLKGVAGRAIAAVPGYTYSAGLKGKAGKKWTPAELNAFMADPRGYAPGSKMMLKVEDAQKRADIIAFLQSL
jgi:cytochrome c